MADADIGLYGFRLAGLRARAASEPVPPADWPRWTFSQRAGPADEAGGTTIEPDWARTGLPGTGELRLSRPDRRIVLHAPVPCAAEAIEHPLLVPAAATVAHWQDRVALHAGAVLVDGGVWGVLGDRGAGKSTLAAGLVALGAAPFADDLLVVAGGTAFAGPPFVDLRADVAARFGATRLGDAGGRERWRLPAANHRLSAPLRGWVALAPAPGPTRIEPLAPRDRVRVLMDQIGLPVAADRLLALADRPALALHRSTWSDADAERVFAFISGLTNVSY